MVKPYMVRAYAFLISEGRRTIESLPEAYRIPVAEYLAAENEKPVA